MFLKQRSFYSGRKLGSIFAAIMLVLGLSVPAAAVQSSSGTKSIVHNSRTVGTGSVTLTSSFARVNYISNSAKFRITNKDTRSGNRGIFGELRTTYQYRSGTLIQSAAPLKKTNNYTTTGTITTTLSQGVQLPIGNSNRYISTKICQDIPLAPDRCVSLVGHAL